MSSISSADCGVPNAPAPMALMIFHLPLIKFVPFNMITRVARKGRSGTSVSTGETGAKKIGHAPHCEKCGPTEI